MDDKVIVEEFMNMSVDELLELQATTKYIMNLTEPSEEYQNYKTFNRKFMEIGSGMYDHFETINYDEEAEEKADIEYYPYDDILKEFMNMSANDLLILQKSVKILMNIKEPTKNLEVIKLYYELYNFFQSIHWKLDIHIENYLDEDSDEDSGSENC